MDALPGPPQRQSLRFCKAFFEVTDAEATATALERAGAIQVAEPDADRWFTWQEPPRDAGLPRARFLLRLRSGRMVLEGPTPDSVGRGWRALEPWLKPHAQARVAAGDDLGRFVPRKRRHSGDRPESWDPSHEAQVLAEFYAAFCDRWIRLPHGALDGMSPAQAAADPAMSDRVEALLQRMERIEQERVSRGMASFSVDGLRGALDREGWAGAS